MTASVTGSSVRSGVDAYHESETTRLQKEVDMFTQKLENEKRKLLITEEQIKQVQNELNEKNNSIQKIRPVEIDDKKDKIKLGSQAHQIKNQTLSLNQTRSQNNSLRREIDMLRKELMSSLNECKRLTNQTKKVRKIAESENKEAVISKRIAEEHINQSIALRAKHEEDKDHFEADIKRMQEKLYEKDEENKFEDKQFDQSLAATKNKDKNGDSANPIAILKLRLAKIVATNKEKKRLMDQYLRNVKVIEDAFEQIKEASGITSIEEIVTSFIKAEEQNYSLLNYVNRLGTETDVLEDSNREISDQINRIIERKDLSSNERQNLKTSMEDECKFYDTEIERNNNEAEATKKMFRQIQEHVQIMVELFKRSKFYLSVAAKMSYDDGIVFTENNIVAYLAELEEHICSLVTYSAFKKDDPNAAISAIPLAQLNHKEFGKKELDIEAPSLPQPYYTDPILEKNFDNFNEKQYQNYFQKVVKDEVNTHANRMAASSGVSDARGAGGGQDFEVDQDEQPGDF